MKTKTILIMLISLMFLFGNTLDAKRGSQRSMRHSGFGLQMAEKNLLPARMLLRFKTEIGLTDVQVKKIEKMQLNYQAFNIKSSTDAKLLGLKISTEFNAAKVNRGKITSLIKKVGIIKSEMQVSRINYLLDVRSVLTKAQIDKINSLRLERRANRGKRGNRSMNQKNGMRNSSQRNNRGNRF